MKNKIYILAVVFLIVAVVFGGTYIYNNYTYNKAVRLIEDNCYEEGLSELDKLSTEPIDRKDFNWYVKRNELKNKKYYRNTIPLYAYAISKIEYAKDEKYLPDINQLLELIDNDYSGELATEIKTFKEIFKVEYDEYLAEQERISEEKSIEWEKYKEEREREYRESLRNKIPYVGMSESYINYTVMGNYHDREYVVVGKGKRTEWDKVEYRWKNSNGKTILYVECRDGVVTDVIKYGESKYWTSDGKPIYSGTRSGYSSSYSGKKKVYNDDSYNVNDYYDAEDFYEDYYDDFYDYEDAEDYFEENRDW